MKRRAGPYWQAYCPGCGHELGTFKPRPAGETTVCAKCGTVSVVELTPFDYPVCYRAEGEL